MERGTDDPERRRGVRPLSSQLGAAAVEYALLVGFIAAVVITTVTLLGAAVLGLFERVDWW